MDAAAPKTLDNHSHVVRPAEMEWKRPASLVARSKVYF